MQPWKDEMPCGMHCTICLEGDGRHLKPVYVALLSVSYLSPTHVPEPCLITRLRLAGNPQQISLLCLLGSLKCHKRQCQQKEPREEERQVKQRKQIRHM